MGRPHSLILLLLLLLGFITRVVLKLVFILSERTSNTIYWDSNEAQIFCKALPFQQAPVDVWISNRSQVVCVRTMEQSTLHAAACSAAGFCQLLYICSSWSIRTNVFVSTYIRLLTKRMYFWSQLITVNCAPRWSSISDCDLPVSWAAATRALPPEPCNRRACWVTSLVLACCRSSSSEPWWLFRSWVPNFHCLRGLASSNFQSQVSVRWRVVWYASAPLFLAVLFRPRIGGFPFFFRGLVCCQSAAPHLISPGPDRPSDDCSVFSCRIRVPANSVASYLQASILRHVVPPLSDVHPSFQRHSGELSNTSLCHFVNIIPVPLWEVTSIFSGLSTSQFQFCYWLYIIIHVWKDPFPFSLSFCSGSVLTIPAAVRRKSIFICIPFKLASHSMYLRLSKLWKHVINCTAPPLPLITVSHGLRPRRSSALPAADRYQVISGFVKTVGCTHSKKRKEKNEQKHKIIHLHLPHLSKPYFLSRNTIRLKLNMLPFVRPIF